MGTKQSKFTEIQTLDDTKFVPVFGAGTNEKISKENLFDQIKDETQIFIYPTTELLQAADLVADPDFPIYVRNEQTGYWLYKITSLAAGVNDIAMDNGATATFQDELRCFSVGVVADLASLSLLVGSEVSTKGCLVIGDGGHGTFIVEAASGTPDGYSRVLLANGLHAVLQGPWNIQQFGIYVNQLIDSTAGVNRAFSALRNITLPQSTGLSAVLYGCAGKVLVSSVNATQIRAQGWKFDGRGVTFLSATPGAVVFDLLHSRFATIENTNCEGDEAASPLVGFQIGYMSGQVSSGYIEFRGCYTFGRFTRTAFYNGGSEESEFHTCQWRNTNTASTAYAYIADSSNFWRRTSAYAVGDQVTKNITGITQANPAVVTSNAHTYTNGTRVTIADVGGMTEVNGLTFTVDNVTTNTFELSGINSTAYGAYTSGGTVAKLKTESFVQVLHDNVAFFKTNGGPGIWQGWSSDRHEYKKCYCYTPGGFPIVVYMDPVESGGLYHQQLEFDVGIEGHSSTGIYFQRANGGDIRISGFKFKDHGPQVNGQIFLTDPGPSGDITLVGADIDIARLPDSPTSGLFNPSGKFNMTGRISSRNTAGISGMPRRFKGTVDVVTAEVSAYGIGSYDINAVEITPDIDVAHAFFKGAHRYVGSKDGTIAAGALDVEKWVEVSRNGVEWSTDTGTAVDASITFTTNVMTTMVDGVSSTRTANRITEPLALRPTFADDAAAGAGGLTAGQMYKTATGVCMVKL